MRKNPDVVVWRGIGFVSPRGLFLEAFGYRTLRVCESSRCRGSRLVLVTARLEKVTGKQIRESGDLLLGFVAPEGARVRGRKAP